MPKRSTPRPIRWLSYFAAVLAVVAQLAVVLAPVAEGRDGIGAPAHVDAAGTMAHYAHNESMCAACQARSLHGTLRLPAAPIGTAVAPTFAGQAPAPLVPSYDPARQNLSRAPPRAS